MSIQNFKGRIWQQEAIGGLRKYTFISCHRRAGKSYMLAYLLARRLVIPVPNQTYLFACPMLQTSKRVILRPLQNFLSDSPQIKWLVGENRFLNAETKSEIILAGVMDRTARALRGLGSQHIVLDEISGYSPDDYYSIILPIASECDGYVTVCGTPAAEFTLFAEIEKFHKDQILAGNPEYAYFKFDVNQTDVFSQIQIATMKTQMKTSFHREYELRTDVGDEKTFITMDQLDALTYRSPEGDYGIERTEPPAAGFDVALRRDNSALVIRWDHTIVAMERIMGTPSEQVSKVYKCMIAHNCDILVYDLGGLGEAFREPLDRLIERDLKLEVRGLLFQGRSSNPALYKNVRSQLYRNLQDWLALASTCLPSGSEFGGLAGLLLEEISSILVKPVDDNVFTLESKKEIRKRLGRSTDYSDALAMTTDLMDEVDEKSYLGEQGMRSTAEILERYPELYRDCLDPYATRPAP